ncbi:unnamed protein product [Absidia cylindrospora]
MNTTEKSSSALHNAGHYSTQPHSHQHQDGFDPITAGAMAISPPRPSQFLSSLRTPFPLSSPSTPSTPSPPPPPPPTTTTTTTAAATMVWHFTRDDLIISPSHSTTYTESMYHTGEEDEGHQQLHMQEMFDKRRRRRESHNMVERRRRDNINERIQELCSLLPTHLLDTNTSPIIGITGSQKSPSSINKGTILKLSVDHIKELRDQVMHYQQRISELEQVLYHNSSKQQQSGLPHPYQHQHMQSTLFNPIQPLPIQSLQPLGSTTDKEHGHHPYNNHNNLML